MTKQTTMIVGVSVVAIALLSAVAFFFFQSGTAPQTSIPISMQTPQTRETEEGLGAQLLAQAQNPLAQAAVTVNPFAVRTNPFIADANIFNTETNPLKTFYQNPFQ